MNLPITHLEAWQHFYQDFKKSDAWHSLTAAERNQLITADRDSRGERADKYGKPLHLGFKRVAAMLSKYAPGVYEVIEIRGFIVNSNK